MSSADHDISALMTRFRPPHPLREYQSRGVSFLLHNDGALLADEMGLGKTVQAITAVRILIGAKMCYRVLVVAPRSLRVNWKREFATWAPELLVRIVAGNRRNRHALYGLPLPVLIATYDQVRLDAHILQEESEFGIVILDEAQRIKNRSSRTSLACRGLPRARSWALTGTPLENEIGDLVSVFTFVKRGLISEGLPLGTIHSQISPHFLRRTKQEVLPELPHIIDQDILLELEPEQRRAYDDLLQSELDQLRSRGSSYSEAHLFSTLTKLKLMCNYDPQSNASSKLRALMLFLQNLTLPTDRVLVFSQYVKTLEWIARQSTDVPYRLFHGDLTDEQRQDAVDWFRSQGPAVLLMSLKAGGTGLNLVEASTVIMFDRWWNPAVEEQAVHRAHRFGRERPLHVVKFMTVDTIEERIQNILDEKRLLFETVVDGAPSTDAPTFSKEVLRRILGLKR